MNASRSQHATLIAISIPALALLFSTVGCDKNVVEAADEKPQVSTRVLGEQCWTSGATPCGPGLACLPDPAFDGVGDPADASAGLLLAAVALEESPPDVDGGNADSVGRDPGSRPWMCQPSP